VPAVGMAAPLGEVLAAPVPTLPACHGGLRVLTGHARSPCLASVPQGIPSARHCSRPVNKQETLSPRLVHACLRLGAQGHLPAVRSHRHPSLCTRGWRSPQLPGWEQGRELLRQRFPPVAMDQEAFTKWKECEGRRRGAGRGPGPLLPAGPSSRPRPWGAWESWGPWSRRLRPPCHRGRLAPLPPARRCASSEGTTLSFGLPRRTGPGGSLRRGSRLAPPPP